MFVEFEFFAEEIEAEISHLIAMDLHDPDAIEFAAVRVLKAWEEEVIWTGISLVPGSAPDLARFDSIIAGLYTFEVEAFA